MADFQYINYNSENKNCDTDRTPIQQSEMKIDLIMLVTNLTVKQYVHLGTEDAETNIKVLFDLMVKADSCQSTHMILGSKYLHNILGNC